MRSATAREVDYGQHESAMQEYLRAGEARAFSLGNRGPIRLDSAGKLLPEIEEGVPTLRLLHI